MLRQTLYLDQKPPAHLWSGSSNIGVSSSTIGVSSSTIGGTGQQSAASPPIKQLQADSTVHQQSRRNSSNSNQTTINMPFPLQSPNSSVTSGPSFCKYNSSVTSGPSFWAPGFADGVL